MTLTVITPPDALPVPDNELKDYLRIGHDGEDALVAELNAAATERVETELDQVLVRQTLQRTYRGWPASVSGRGAMLLPVPVASLSAVIVKSDAHGDEDVTGRFRLACGRLLLRPWSIAPPVPVDGCVEVTFEAGYGDPEDVPADLKMAIRMIAASTYLEPLGPGRAMELSGAVTEILSAHRRVRL